MTKEAFDQIVLRVCALMEIPPSKIYALTHQVRQPGRAQRAVRERHPGADRERHPRQVQAVCSALRSGNSTSNTTSQGTPTVIAFAPRRTRQPATSKVSAPTPSARACSATLDRATSYGPTLPRALPSTTWIADEIHPQTRRMTPVTRRPCTVATKVSSSEPKHPPRDVSRSGTQVSTHG